MAVKSTCNTNVSCTKTENWTQSFEAKASSQCTWSQCLMPHRGGVALTWAVLLGKLDVNSLSKHCCWTLPEITPRMRYFNLLVCGSFETQNSNLVIDDHIFFCAKRRDAPPLLTDMVHTWIYRLTDTAPTALSERATSCMEREPAQKKSPLQ